jgi:hypothetical protein
MRNAIFQTLYDKARSSGLFAGQEVKPRPMVVVEHANPLDDHSRVVNQWHVPEGVCGFAWINLRPGNHPFCNWLKKQGLGRRDSYYGGVTVWVQDFDQSHTRKVSYAHAFAQVINEAKLGSLTAHPGDRLD